MWSRDRYNDRYNVRKIVNIDTMMVRDSSGMEDNYVRAISIRLRRTTSVLRLVFNPAFN
jgi:hypothetical protein